MAYLPLKIPPGVVKDPSEYATPRRWKNANLIRWVSGRLIPVGGWESIVSSPVADVPRTLIAWLDNEGTTRLAYASASHLYVQVGMVPHDITPDSLAPGRDTGSFGAGYGRGKFGGSTYGTQRNVPGAILGATVWDITHFGEYLIALSPADGRILMWKPDDGYTTDASEIDKDAPKSNTGVVVTDTRFIVALGAGGDPRAVHWCSQEDYTTWIADTTNSAGAIQLNTDGVIFSGVAMPGEVVIFTNRDVHALRYVGSPFYFGRERIATGAGIVSRLAYSSVGGILVWLSDAGFYIYDGAVQPLPCPIWGWVQRNLNQVQRSKIVAGANLQYKEFWWFLPTDSDENDVYVVWNYAENWWTVGEVGRSAWFSFGQGRYPIAADAGGEIYEHEKGWLADGHSRVNDVFAETASFDLGNGERVMEADQLLPDEAPAEGIDLKFKFRTAYTPNGPEKLRGPFTLSRSDGYVDVRFNGRQVAMRIEPSTDGYFQMGEPRLRVQKGGRR